MAEGLEPSTLVLTGLCSTIALHHNINIGVTYPIQVSSEGIYLVLNTKLAKNSVLELTRY